MINSSFKFKILFLIVAGVFVNLVGCSDQKDQVPQGKGVPNPSINTNAVENGVSPSEEDDRFTIPGNVADRLPNTGFDPRESLDNERDDNTELNSKKPIIFDGINPNNSGLAGLTFKTSLDEATQFLSDPVEYECGFFYEEGMCIQWQKDGSQRPTQIIIIKSYLGEIELPQPIGKIRMGADLTRFFAPGDPVGKSVVEMLYRSFFKIEDPNYSCVTDGKCEAREVEEAIIWRLPNIFFQLSKNGGKQVFLILLENKFDSGILQGDFDLIQNTFTKGSDQIRLGQAWGEVKKIGGVQDVESIIQTTNFRKDYDGVNAWVYRPDAFQSAVSVETTSANLVEPVSLTKTFIAPTEASDSDSLGGVSLFGSYPGKFTLNGQFIKINSQGDVFLSADSTESGTEFLLKTQVQFLADKYDVQVKILKNLQALIVKDLESKFGSNLNISVRYDGLEARPAAGKWINFTINYATAPTAALLEAGFMFVGISVQNGYLQVLKEITYDPFVQNISMDFETEIKLVDFSAPAAPVSFANQLQGFKLGDEVELTDIDWLRSEASFVMGGQSVRTEFEPRGYIRVSYVDNETEILNAWTVTGVGRLALALTPLDQNPYVLKTVKFRISAITSHLNPIGIRGLCGFDLLAARDSSYGQLRTLLVDESKNKKQMCSFFGRGNDAEDGEYDQMFFPNQKIKLIFTNKLFTGVTIYE